MPTQNHTSIHYLTCECSHPAHTIRVVYESGSSRHDEDPSIMFEVQLAELPWYRRLWVAFLYVIGKHETVYTGWTDHLLTDEGIATLDKVLQKYHLTKALRKTLRAKRAKETRNAGQPSKGVDNPS